MDDKNKHAKLFFRFLKECNCFYKFIANFKNGVEDRNFYLAEAIKGDNNLNKLESFQKYYILLNSPEAILVCSFSWALSNEGFLFWSNINELWRKNILNDYTLNFKIT